MKLIQSVRGQVSAMVAAISSGYHPERHYMRGPGPACAARAFAQMPGADRRAAF